MYKRWKHKKVYSIQKLYNKRWLLEQQYPHRFQDMTPSKQLTVLYVCLIKKVPTLHFTGDTGTYNVPLSLSIYKTPFDYSMQQCQVIWQEPVEAGKGARWFLQSSHPSEVALWIIRMANVLASCWTIQQHLVKQMEIHFVLEQHHYPLLQRHFRQTVSPYCTPC